MHEALPLLPEAHLTSVPTSVVPQENAPNCPLVECSCIVVSLVSDGMRHCRIALLSEGQLTAVSIPVVPQESASSVLLLGCSVLLFSLGLMAWTLPAGSTHSVEQLADKLQLVACAIRFMEFGASASPTSGQS